MGAGLVLEKDAHTQSCNAPTTPVRDDPEQRFIVLDCGRFLAFPVKALLKHHKPGKDSKIEWGMWRESVAASSHVKWDDLLTVWVFGCRFFVATLCREGTQPMMQVYDFSVEGREPNLESEPDPELGGVRTLKCAGERIFPQYGDFVHGSRDTLMFTTDVSATSLLERAK